MDINLEEIRKILVIDLGGIGDVLLATPSLRTLKSQYPYSHIYLLVVRRVYELAKRLPYIDEILLFNFSYGLNSIITNLKMLLFLRKERIDLAINMRTITSRKSAMKIGFLLEIINPRIKAGRDTEGRGWFFDVKIPETDTGQKYEMEYDIEVLEALGIEVLDRGIDFAVDNENFKKIDDILEKEGVSKKEVLIGIHPGGQPSRRWAIENFAEVIKEIHKKIACKFVITGVASEVNLVHNIVKMSNLNVINLAGKLNIIELGALIKRCGLYISNDTGPVHIAAVLKTPLVAIFGPGHIIRFDPRNISQNAVVFYKKVDCAPCNKITCNSMKCLKIISPDEVVKAALDLLKGEK